MQLANSFNRCIILKLCKIILQCTVGLLSCSPPGPCYPPLLAPPSSLPWQLRAPQNFQTPRSQPWSAWTCGRDTGCCRKACDGHRGRGSSGFPSERHCTGSSGTGKACDLREEKVASHLCAHTLPAQRPKGQDQYHQHHQCYYYCFAKIK